MSWLRSLLLVVATVLGTTAVADAGFVVIANHTDQELRFTVSHPEGQPKAETLPAGASRLIPVGQRPELSYTAGGKAVRYGLDPYTAYVFAANAGTVGLHGVEMAAALPKPDDVPAFPLVLGGPWRVPVHLLVDDADPRVQAAWEKALRSRLTLASEALEQQCGVRFEVVAVGEWESNADAADFPAQAKDFESKVKPAAKAALALGFTSRAIRGADDRTVRLAGCSHGPLATHILIREGHPRAESERVEVLFHELAHVFGAAHAPDPFSSMRPRLGDGRAARSNFRIALDPLNLLAVGLWVEELRGGKVKTWEDLKPVTRERLRVVYKSLAHLAPDDPVAVQYGNILDGLREPGAVARDPAPPVRVPAKEPAAPMDDPGGEVLPPRPKPAPASNATELTPLQDAVRKVVRVVTLRATDVHRLAADARPKGDKLTAEYVRAAADLAVTLEDNLQAPAFLIGLGIALDDSTVLRDNPLTGKLCKAVESDAERRERLVVLGAPTVRNRRDLCQHFVVSTALTELLGPQLAETTGITKELMDLTKTGFSFADLAADFAGVAFAKKVKAERVAIAQYRDEFKVEDVVPSITGLREGLTTKEFETEYGKLGDPRFEKALDEVRKLVAEMPAFRR